MSLAGPAQVHQHSQHSQYSQPNRPARSSFRVPGRPAPSPPVGVEPASARLPRLPMQLGPLPHPPALQRHPTVPPRAPPKHGHMSRASHSAPASAQHSPNLSSQLSPSQLNYMAAQQLSSAQLAPRALPPIQPPRRNRSLSKQSYHALMPELATVSDLAVPEEDETDLPYGGSKPELAVLTDHTGRRCSIIAITPSVGRKAKCHYDPFARRRQTLQAVIQLPDVDSDSVLSSYSAGGASGVFVRSDGSHWTAVEEGCVRSMGSARVAQFV